MTAKEKRAGIIGGLVFITLGIVAIVYPDLMDGAEPSGRHYLLKLIVTWLWSRPAGVVAVLLGGASIWGVFKPKPAGQSDSSKLTAGASQPKKTNPKDFLASIPGLAEVHVKQCREVFAEDLDYSEASIGKLDDIIKKGWPDGPPAMLETTVITFGAYLGEAIRRNLGGDWGFSEQEGYFLENVGGQLKVFPFTKTLKRFKDGEGDSLGFYYVAVKHMIEREEQLQGGAEPQPSAGSGDAS